MTGVFLLIIASSPPRVLSFLPTHTTTSILLIRHSSTPLRPCASFPQRRLTGERTRRARPPRHLTSHTADPTARPSERGIGDIAILSSFGTCSSLMRSYRRRVAVLAAVARFHAAALATAVVAAASPACQESRTIADIRPFADAVVGMRHHSNSR